MRHHARTALAGLTLEAGLVVAWSSGFIGGVLATETRSVFLVLFWRFVALVALLLPIAGRILVEAGPQRIARQALVGALAMFGFLAGAIGAINLGVPAATTALVAALQPLATAAVAGAVLRETVSPRQWTGLLVGLAGVAVATSGPEAGASPEGYALSLASMASLVAGTLLAKADPEPLPVVPALAVQSATAAVLFMPLAALDGGLAPEATRPFAFAVLWFVALSTLGGYGLYWMCLARTSATRVASLIYLTPPVTAVWALLMFGDPITVGQVAGFGLALIGVALAADGTPRLGAGTR